MVIPPFETKVVCQNCSTYLKVEETETTISTIVITETAFLELDNKPIPYVNENRKNLQSLKNDLKQLEENWRLEQENFKIKNGKKRILPRRKNSLTMLILGFGMFGIGVYSFLFSNDSNFVLFVIGISFISSSSREFVKFRKYKVAKEDFIDEKERLEYEILLLEK